MLVGAVADDDSGMTDLLGMFAEHDMKTVMFFKTRPHDILERFSENVDVIAIGTSARSIEPNEAYKRTKEALDAISCFTPRMYYLKYCSTFDSTPSGNIGQMIDAGLDLLGGSTISLPALPVNGRTTYMGNHFVDGVRLDRSSMKDHPLNPMSEADLTIWLSYQTERRIGLCNYNIVRRGSSAIVHHIKRLKDSGVEIIIMDAIEQRDIRNIARATYDHKLVTGSSALAMELPPLWRRRGLLSKKRHRTYNVEHKKDRGSLLVITGSCSDATIRQNRYAMKKGFYGLKMDTQRIVQGKESFRDEIERVVREGGKELRRGKNVIVYTADDKEDVVKTKALGIKLGFTDLEIGKMISNADAEIAMALVDNERLNKIIVAGGETSGAICRKLKLIGLYVGKQIDPGVPLCLSISEDPEYSGMVLSLKSGNFGSYNFYEKALRLMTDRFRWRY